VDEFADAIERALLDGPAGPRALARLLDRNPGTVARKLAAMTERGVIERTPHGFELITAPKEQDR
jgi:DNA-binding IclR family transcriptional regulator